ncbi:MAG: DegQ family serine endoprotease [Alphaproteobacteria bacterium]|nr:DegQ family serine endoprotease [Alphaproteobacteria bacterium]
MRIKRLAIATVALIAFAAPAVAAPSLPQAPMGGQQMTTIAPLIKEVTPAVVNITVKTKAPVEENPLFQDPFLRRFFNLPGQPQREQQTQSVGSGVIIDAKKGYILTNHHVINNAVEINVTLKDQRVLKAKLVGGDPETDIALLQVPAESLTQIPLGDSEKLEVGDFVVAVGNPFGLGQTVTMGIVSALGRSGLGIEGYEDFIQTDASINPGNSGGALVNMKGELIGINTAILGPAGGNIGIGFAVPIDMARAVTDHIVQYGEVRRGRIGVSVQDLTPDIALALKLDKTQGALVTRVEPGSPADKAGLKEGDVVTSIAGRTVKSGADLRNRIGLLRVGDKVELAVSRDKSLKNLTVQVAKKEPQTAARASEITPRLAGATFNAVQPSSTQPQRLRGIEVATVDRDSAAWQAGLRPGDIVTAVNREPVTTIDGFTRSVRATAQGPIALNLIRGDSRMVLIVQ